MQQMSEIIVQSAKLILEAVPLLSSIGTNAGRLNALTTKLINVQHLPSLLVRLSNQYLNGTLA
jgi:hypothetical protein